MKIFRMFLPGTITFFRSFQLGKRKKHHLRKSTFRGNSSPDQGKEKTCEGIAGKKKRSMLQEGRALAGEMPPLKGEVGCRNRKKVLVSPREKIRQVAEKKKSFGSIGKRRTTKSLFTLQ